VTKNETILLESISDRLTQVHEALYGNGDPSKSMMASQVRQEAAVVQAADAARIAACKADSLADSMAKVAVSVDAHHAKMHMHDIIKSPKIWGYVLLVFVAVNVIVDVANPWVLALIKTWTGITVP
jgi:hypothetical protein